MGREVGGGIGMGNTCEPKAFSFQSMTKFTTKKKKKTKTIKKKKSTNEAEIQGSNSNNKHLTKAFFWCCFPLEAQNRFCILVQSTCNC